MELNKKIFLSHSSHDEAEVKEVKLWLEEIGLETWVSFDDINNLDQKKIISLALSGCDYFLLILSEQSIKSRAVKGEIQKALDEEKEIFIYALQDTTYPPGIDIDLNRVQRIDKFKFPNDHLVRLAKIILNEIGAKPGEIEQLISNALSFFNEKAEKARLEYLAKLRAWTDDYLDSRWDNGKFKSAPSKICSEELKDLADTLGLKDKDILQAQQIKRDKKKFLALLNSALRKKTISSRSLKTLEKKRYESGVSKKEVKESISRRKFVPRVIHEAKSSPSSGNHLDIEWLIKVLNQRREILADTSHGNDKSDQNIIASQAKDERTPSNSILESHSNPKKQLLDVQKITCSEANLNTSKIVSKNSDSEEPLFSEPQKALSAPSKDKQATAASGNSIAKSAVPESTNQIDKTKVSSKSYQFSSKSIVYKPAKNPKTDFVELTEIRQEGSCVIFIGKKGSRKIAYQEKFETGFVRAIRWNRLFKLYFAGNRTSLQLEYITGSQDSIILEEFISNLNIPVLDVLSANGANQDPESILFPRDQLTIEAGTKIPLGQSQDIEIKTLSDADKHITIEGAGINPFINWPWIDPGRLQDIRLYDAIAKQQKLQNKLITMIDLYDSRGRIEKLFKGLKEPLNLLYGQDLVNDQATRKLLKEHELLHYQGCDPLLCFMNNGLISKRSLILFGRGVSFRAGHDSRKFFKFGIPAQRIAGRIDFKVDDKSLKIKVSGPTLQSQKQVEASYIFRPAQSRCQAFSESLLKILTELDDHQINYARLRESLVNELWEGLSSQNLVAPVSFHLYGNSVITSLAKPSLDPISTALFNSANAKIPGEQDILFSLSASYSAPMNNYRSAILVALHGIAFASKTALEIRGQFINWSDLSEFIFAQTGRSFFEVKIKTKCLRSQILWPTLPGKEQVFSEIAAFVMSLKERLYTLPAR